jgi:hypothetical protein
MRFGFAPNSGASREIVGVVGDVRDVALSQKPGPAMYVPFAQAPLYGGEVIVRSSLSTSSVAAAIRQEVHSIDKNLPVTDVEPLPSAIEESISQERFRTFLLGSFSAMALVDGDPALRRVGGGSPDIWGRGSCSARGFSDRLLHPGPSRAATRSDDRPKKRVSQILSIDCCWPLSAALRNRTLGRHGGRNRSCFAGHTGRGVMLGPRLRSWLRSALHPQAREARDARRVALPRGDAYRRSDARWYGAP